jgi:quercetin 2,3-dioxygenase
VLGGVLEHGDNLGNAGALQAGDVQWMTAGRGIIHRELALRGEQAHTLQLWLNLPGRAKLVPTRYQDLAAAGRPRVDWPGVVIEVISGDIAGTGGPALNHWPVQAAVVTLDPGAECAYPLPAAHRAFAHVLRGQAGVAGRTVAEGHTAWSDPLPPAPAAAGSVLRLVAGPEAPCRMMIYSGEPIGEPVAFGGPFVMNTPAEIEAAFADFRAGKFGEIPLQARLKYDR